MNTRTRWCIAACAFLMIASFAACGRKTAPVVPDSPRPEQVHGITAVTRGAEAFLSWPLPTKNVEGKNLSASNIRAMRIYRAEFGPDRRKGRYKLYAEIDIQNPAPATVRNDVVIWSDDNLKYGYAYGYRIRAVSERGGVSQPSEEVRVTPSMPLAIPQGIRAVEGDNSVRVTWEPVTGRLDGTRVSGFIGYNIYRGNEAGRHDEAPLNPEPLTATTYIDKSTLNGRAYYYLVRSVDRPTRPWQESPDSLQSSATPRDMTPPDRPTKLTAVPGVDRVFLTWNENGERDLAGYYVYRSTRSGRDYERLTDKPLNRTTYSDMTVKVGTTYFYAVSAVDTSGNESTKSEERKAFVEKFR